MALTAALALQKAPRIGALFGGSDGTDGQAGAAGSFAFAATVARMGSEAAARAFLAGNDSHHPL